MICEVSRCGQVLSQVSSVLRLAQVSEPCRAGLFEHFRRTAAERFASGCSVGRADQVGRWLLGIVKFSEPTELTPIVLMLGIKGQPAPDYSTCGWDMNRLPIPRRAATAGLAQVQRV